MVALNRRKIYTLTLIAHKDSFDFIANLAIYWTYMDENRIVP